jgi:hypothetical protein
MHAAPGQDVAHGAEGAVGEFGQLPQGPADLLLLHDERLDPCPYGRVWSWAGRAAELWQGPEVRSRGIGRRHTVEAGLEGWRPPGR